MFQKVRFSSLGLALIRVLTGIILIKVGIEIFSKESMSGYVQWLTDLRFPLPKIMAYVGKLAELIGGVSFILGYGVRWSSVPVIVTMAVITFIMGEGSITDNAFLILMLAAVYLCLGSGSWSIDHMINGRKDA